MILQDILWPDIDTSMQEEMYFRTEGDVVRFEKSFSINKGGMISSDTYFNGISVDKWNKYTQISNLGLALNLKGNLRLQLGYKKKVNDTIYTNIVFEGIYNLNNSEEISINIPVDEGMAYFKIDALSDQCILSGGYYFSDTSDLKIRNVNIAICICTFRREKFVEHNLDVLKKNILNNPESELYQHMEVLVSDNGGTLDIERLSTEQIHIFKNKNAGGTAGFTRDLIEILQSNEIGKGITHALLMDDDIIIEPESLLKTYRILMLLKDEYIDTFIGGAMLRDDARNIQVESGASWNAGNLISLKGGLDLNTCFNCLYNETEEYCEYNAWWYCCIPMSVVSDDNLPIPIFIRGDDVEYGLRNMKNLILMNGICVWHEPFENKYSSYLSYYILRNLFIDNALHFPNYNKKDARKKIMSEIIREIVYFRYKNVDLIIRGVRDFLSGIDWLKETDGEQLHQEILAAGYKAVSVEQLPIHFLYNVYNNSRIEVDNGLKKVIRFATINGYLLKPKRDNIVSMSGIRPYNAYRANRILNYDVTTNKGFVTQRNRKEAIRCIKEMFKVIREVNNKYDSVAEEYRLRQEEVQNIKFWKGYLDLSD